MAERHVRMWGLFRRPRGSAKHIKWERLFPQSQYTRPRATEVFQNQLLYNAMGHLDVEYEYRLRPVTPARTSETAGQ